MRFIITEILYLRQNVKPMEEENQKRKTSNFQYPVDHEDRLSIRPSSLL